MVIVGSGVCNWRSILAAAAKRGQWDLALEPHLDQAERHFGHTSPERFAGAHRALLDILAEI